MIIQPIPPNNPTFGVYKNTKVTGFGTKVSGIINGYKLDIYTAKEGSSLIHKLFVLSDSFGQWVKSKLVYYAAGHKSKIIRSEKV